MELILRIDYTLNGKRFRKGQVAEASEEMAEKLIRIGVAYQRIDAVKEIKTILHTKELKTDVKTKRGRKPKNEG